MADVNPQDWRQWCLLSVQGIFTFNGVNNTRVRVHSVSNKRTPSNLITSQSALDTVGKQSRKSQISQHRQRGLTRLGMPQIVLPGCTAVILIRRHATSQMPWMNATMQTLPGAQLSNSPVTAPRVCVPSQLPRT